MSANNQSVAAPVQGAVVQGVVVGREPRSPIRYAAGANVEKGQADTEVLNPSCLDATLPAEIRLGFVKKVYGIVCVMLLVTFGIASPFIFATEDTLQWMRSNMWLVTIVSLILLVQHIFNICMVAQMCCGGSSLFLGYMKMFKTVPFNYLYLGIYACCFGFVTGFITARYTVESVLVVFGISFVLILALTAYAVYTKADFTGCGAYVLVGLLGLILVVLVGFFFPIGSVFHRIIGVLGATLFGFIIVYDTQLIFGSASLKLGGGSRKFEYSIDMYAFAAFNLYLDFVNFFLFLLQALGERR